MRSLHPNWNLGVGRFGVTATPSIGPTRTPACGCLRLRWLWILLACGSISIANLANAALALVFKTATTTQGGGDLPT